MPVVNLTLPTSMSPERRKNVSNGIHSALVDEFDAPQNGKFHIVTLYDSDKVLMDPSFLGTRRSDNFIFVQISVMNQRTDDQKRALLRRIRSNVAAMADLRPEDFFINILESPSSNWFCLMGRTGG